MAGEAQFKVRAVAGGRKRPAWKAYRELCYGDVSAAAVLRNELLVLLVSCLPGAAGLLLRGWLYPRLFRACGKKVVFGRGITLRHPHKISLGDRVIIDDGAVLDAKGEGNRGIDIGSDVYVGRNTIVYTKDGNITVGDRVNLSSNCQVFSSNELAVGPDTMIGAYAYLLSGGEYDPADPTPFSQQAGTRTKGPLQIGPNNWLGARVTVLDAASTGEHCVLAAGAVVTRPVPPHSLAGGVPARVLKSLAPGAARDRPEPAT